MRGSIVLVACLAVALSACGNKDKGAAKPDGATTAGANADGATAGPGGTGGPGALRATPVDGPATLKGPDTTGAGANMSIAWTGPNNTGDYVDIVPKGFTDTHGELAYSYVANTNGSVIVRAPTKPGEYDLRYVTEIAGARTVKATAPVSVTAVMAAVGGPATAMAGQALEISWSGPDGKGDYIDMVKAGQAETSGEITYAYTSAGSPAKIEAPSAAGDYDIRYVLEGAGGRTVPAKMTIKVTLPKATLSAPGQVGKGKPFKVEWTGPRSSGDYVDLVKKGQTATSGELGYFYVTQGASGELTAKDPGEYDIRYVLEAPGGRVVLATRAVSVR